MLAAGCRRRWFVFGWLATAILVSATPAISTAEEANLGLKTALDSVRASELRTHVDFLASDALEGRGAGTRGGRAASGYLADLFKQYGLTGGGADGTFYQPFMGNLRNVLGVLKGSDPKLAREVIVIGAHYDHVGYGTAQNSFGPTGRIHNGADDNASGTSAVLEVAQAVAAMNPRPKRTILFALWDGEEDGLHGSKHWVGNPTLPLADVKLYVNVDMLGRLRNQRLEVYGTRTARGLRHLISRRNTPDLWLDFNWEMKADSDHYSFFERRVPTLMLHTGLHDDYHRPSDDANKVNVTGLEQISKLLLGLTLELADRPAIPGFRQASEQESPSTQSYYASRRPGPLPPRFGLAWQPPTADQPGAVVTRVVPNTAAAKSGIQVGDRLMQFGSQEITAATPLHQVIWAAPATVDISWVPAGQTALKTAAVTLSGAPVKIGVSWREDHAEPGTMIVNRVIPGTAAAVAGLKLEDRLWAINGNVFPDSKAFSEALFTAQGETELSIERDGRLRTLTLALPPAIEAGIAAPVKVEQPLAPAAVVEPAKS